MDHHSFDDEDFTIKLLNILHDRKSIKRLTLHVYDVRPSSLKEACLIRNSLCQRSFISRLHISESVILDEFIQALIDASQTNCSLFHLEFYDCQITVDQVSKLQSLHDDGNLDHLTISNEQYWFKVISQMRKQLQDGKYFENSILKACMIIQVYSICQELIKDTIFYLCI